MAAHDELEQKPMTVLVVDDHPLFREGLAQLLRDLDGGVEVVGQDDAGRALEYAKSRDDLDLVLLDLTMPGLNGIDAIRRFVQEAPGVPVVIVSGHEEPARVRTALSLGAVGYIPKSTPAAVMADALRLVLRGGIYVPPVMLNEVEAAAHRPTDESGAAATQPLTDRQVDVLLLLALGKSNKVIARELVLSEKTVKAHVTAVFRALGVVNRTQAAMEARRRGLIA
jgi:two-component system, NarL family, nitrate/nitrite response regulator NarL